MAAIPWLWLLHSLHSGQTVVYIVYTTGGAFDLYSSHSTSTFAKRKSLYKIASIRMLFVTSDDYEMYIDLCMCSSALIMIIITVIFSIYKILLCVPAVQKVSKSDLI